MKFNSAICFILSAASLLLRMNTNRRARHLSSLLSGSFLAIAVITIFQGIFGSVLEIDQLFMKDIDAIESGHPFPGRMSPSTALCFFLLGIALLLLNSVKTLSIVVAQSLFHLVTIIAFVALVGYLYNVPELHKLAFITSMALDTALALFFFSIAGSLLNLRVGLTALFSGELVGSIAARKLFPRMLMTVLLLGTLRIIIHRYSWVGIEFSIALHTVAFLLAILFLLWKTSIELNSIDTQRREAEINSSLLTTFLDSTPDPMVILDETGTIQLLNNQTQSVFYFSREELVGKNIKVLIPNGFKNQDGFYRKAFTTQAKLMSMGSEFELYARRKDGTEIPVEISINPIKIGNKKWVSTAIRDIAVRKEAEIKANQLAAIVESLDDGIISKTLSGTITSWNTGAAEIFGYTVAEVIGKHISILFPPELIDEEEIFMKKINNEESVKQYETIRIRKDRSRVSVSITLSPIKDKGRRIIGISKVVRDITEKKKTEEKLINLSILEAKSKEMEQFTYIASHDLRHPLLTIINYIKLLHEDYANKLDAEGKQCLQSISGAATRMDKLILGLLDYSRLSKIKQLETVNCNEIIQFVMADLNSIIKSTNGQITIAGLPTLRGYPIELRQLFQNLIANALKFKKSNCPPEINISAKKDKDRYIFEFRDNGIGIEAKNIEKIFQIFQRVYTSEEYEGTGLGLSYCKKIVELHRGRIWVESKLAQGSSFFFTINT